MRYGLKPVILLMALMVVTIQLSGQNRLAQNEFYAEIKLTDGSSRTGIIKFPKKITDKAIQFRNKESDKYGKIDSESIASMLLSDENEKPRHFVKRSFVLNYKYMSKKKAKKSLDQTEPKMSKVPYFMLCTHANEELFIFQTCHKFKVNKDKSIRLISEGSRGVPPNQYYYAWRYQEEFPTLIILDPNTINARNRYFKMFAPKYFKDCPDLVEAIETELISYDQIDDLISLHSEYCIE